MTDARMGSGQMFDSIADGYDRLNRIMSMGVDQSWRRKTVAALKVEEGHRVLDLATGTLPEREARLRIVRVERHVGATGAHDPEHPDDKIDTSGQAQSHTCLGADSLPP